MEVGNKILVYDRKFRGNILVLGKTASGKTRSIRVLDEIWKECLLKHMQIESHHLDS